MSKNLSSQQVIEALDRLSIEGADGKVIATLKKAFHDLKGTEQHFLDFVEHAPEPAMIHCKGKVEYLNQLGRDLFGITGTYGDDISIFDIFLPEYRELLITQIDRQALGKRIPPFGVGFKDLKGQEKFALAFSVDILYQGAPATRLTFTRVTDGPPVPDYSQEHYATFRSLFGEDQDMAFYFDITGKLMDQNKAALGILGYTGDELFGKHFTWLFPETVESGLSGRLMIKILKAKPHQQESWMYTRRGKHVDIALKVWPRVRKGKVRGILVYCQDITQRKIQENALRESEIFHKSIFGAASDAFLLINQHNEALYLNPGFSRLFGYSLDDLIGQNIHNFLVPQEAVVEAESKSQAAIQGTTEKLILERTRKDGSTVLVEAVGTPVRMKDELCVLVRYSDVTEKIKREKELETLSLVASKTDNHVFFMDRNGYVEWINESMLRFSGFDQEKILGQSILNLLAAGDQDEVMTKAFKEALFNGHSWFGELPFQTARKEIYWVQANLTLIRNEGSADRFFLVTSDITRLKEALARMETSNQELDAFVYQVSHDLKAPLRSLMGLIQLVSLLDAGEEVKEYMTLMMQAVIKLDNSIVDMLELTRTKQEELKSEPVNLEALIRDSLDSLINLANFERIQFSTDFCDLSGFSSDSVLLGIILNNLLSNAVKYCRTDQEVESWVRIEVNRKGDLVSIRVSDNGTGIPAEIQPKIFEMFYRGSVQSFGTGLGLYIVQKAVEKISGNIMLESEPGKGTMFEILVPFDLKMNDDWDV